MFDLLLDNTGLHSAARCLDGSNLQNDDLLGLLNFASQIVFSDSIRLSTYESTGVSERTDEILDFLTKFEKNTQEPVISKLERPSSYYHQCAKKVADDLADELAVGMSFDSASLFKTSILQSAPERISAITNQTNMLKRFRSLNAKGRETLIAKTRETKAGEIPVYAALKSHKLFEQVCEFQKNNHWNVAHTFFLSHVVRYRLYQEIASQCDNHTQIEPVYSPSYSRGIIMKTLNNENPPLNLPNEISNELDKLRTSLIGSSLGINSIAVALITSSKGDPKGIIEKAFELNIETKFLRNELRALIPTENYRGKSTTLTTRRIITSTVKEFNEYLGRKLSIKESPDTLEAIKLVAGICTIPIGGIISYLGGAFGSDALKSFIDSGQNKLIDTMIRNKKYSALSSIIHANDWAAANPHAFKKLQTKTEILSRNIG